MALELPVLLTTQYTKGLGPTVPEVLELAPGVEPIDKLSFGCFDSEAFTQTLSARAPECRSADEVVFTYSLPCKKRSVSASWLRLCLSLAHGLLYDLQYEWRGRLSTAR